MPQNFHSLCSTHSVLASTARVYISYLCLVFIASLAGCGARPGNTDFNIENYRGKWLVLNYWAEWCTPCIKEIPELNKLQAEHPKTLAIAAVNFDGLEGEKLVATSRRFGIEYEILKGDPAESLRLSVPSSLPTTYIFNPQGELTAKLIGPQTVESLLQRIDPKSMP